MFAHLSFLKRWWFWTLLVCALLTLWYTRDRLAWDERQMGYALQNQVTTEYWNAQQRLIAEREAAYRADQYGASTPEETLRLFVEALERKDYVLASKYFVVEEQEHQLSYMQSGVANGDDFTKLIHAFHSGSRENSGAPDSDVYEIDVFDTGDKIPFGFRFIRNPFTQKWKLTDN